MLLLLVTAVVSNPNETPPHVKLGPVPVSFHEMIDRLNVWTGLWNARHTNPSGYLISDYREQCAWRHYLDARKVFEAEVSKSYRDGTQ